MRTCKYYALSGHYREDTAKNCNIYRMAFIVDHHISIAKKLQQTIINSTATYIAISLKDDSCSSSVGCGNQVPPRMYHSTYTSPQIPNKFPS